MWGPPGTSDSITFFLLQSSTQDLSCRKKSVPDDVILTGYDVIEKKVQFSKKLHNSHNFKIRFTYDITIIDDNQIDKSKECIKKYVLHQFHAYRTCHSRVTAYVLFLEHLEYWRF